MWYKKTYYANAEGLDDNFTMIEEFEKFYTEEKEKYPNETRGLAMFGRSIHYFHTKSAHHLWFFMEHKCEAWHEPQPLPECVAGDCKFFSDRLSKNT